MSPEEIIKKVSDGVDAAKAGNALATYTECLPFFADGSLPLKSHYAFAWILYYALHQSADSAVMERKRMLANYFKLRVVTPHKLHSMILTEAVRLAKDARNAAFGNDKAEPFSLVSFMRLWNFANLRPGDWRRKKSPDGKPMSSLAEKVITLYVSELQEKSLQPDPAFMQVMEQALAAFPDSFNLLSQRAAIHILAGEKEEASRMLKAALLEAPGKFFLWSRLASVVDAAAQPHLQIALLFKALKAPGQEQFKGKVRMALAETLEARGSYPMALHELEKVKSLYEANGWHLSKRFNELLKKIPAGTVPADPTDAYRRVEHMADEYVYDALPAIAVKKDYHKNPDPNKTGYGRPVAAWRVIDADGNKYWLTPSRHGIDPDLPLGTPLTIRLHADKVVKASLD